MNSFRIQGDRAVNHLRLSGLALTRSTERLSSGLRLNRAADDVAGIAIHHRHEAQVRGLAQAARNVQDGISATRVADAGLASIGNMLQRARELAVQSANGTLGVSERASLQAELGQLINEIDVVAANAKFNDFTLLAGGSAPTQTFTVNPGETIDVGRVMITAGTPNLVVNAPFGVDAGGAFPDLRITAPNGQQFGYTSPFLNSAAPVTDTTNTASSSAAYNGFNALNEQMTFTDPIAGEWIIRLNNQGGIPVTVTMSASVPLAPLEGALTLQIGANPTQEFTLKAVDARTGALGVDGLSLLSGSSAGSAIASLDAAIRRVSEFRAGFGAAENALEHHVRSIETGRIAAMAADSRLNDADMASTMVQHVRSQLLVQNGMSVLATMDLNARRESSAILMGLLA